MSPPRRRRPTGRRSWSTRPSPCTSATSTPMPESRKSNLRRGRSAVSRRRRRERRARAPRVRTWRPRRVSFQSRCPATACTRVRGAGSAVATGMPSRSGNAAFRRRVDWLYLFARRSCSSRSERISPTRGPPPRRWTTVDDWPRGTASRTPRSVVSGSVTTPGRRRSSLRPRCPRPSARSSTSRCRTRSSRSGSNQRKSASVISKNVVMNALPSSVLCSFRSTHVVPAGS